MHGEGMTNRSLLASAAAAALASVTPGCTTGHPPASDPVAALVERSEQGNEALMSAPPKAFVVRSPGVGGLVVAAAGWMILNGRYFARRKSLFARPSPSCAHGSPAGDHDEALPRRKRGFGRP